MPEDTPVDTTITSRDDFETALKQLVAKASRNGIDPRGSIVCRTAGDGTDLEVVVVALERERSD